MSDFSYIAVNKSGKVQRGILSAVSSEQLRKSLTVRDLELISCERIESQKTLMDIDVGELWRNIFFRKIGDMDKITFAHYMAVMLKAGTPIVETVEVLGEDITNPKLKKLIKKLRSELEAGKTISSLLAKEKFFNEAHIAILKAGESSGKVEEALLRIASDLKRDYQMKRKIKGAMAYPSIILVALIAIGGFITTFVLPKVGEVFKQMNLKIPLPTQILLAIGEFLSKNLLLIAGGIISLGLILAILFKMSDAGMKFLTKVILLVPLVKKLALKISMTRFIRSLSSLLYSGVPIAQALSISGAVFIDSHYQKIIKEAVSRVEKGESLTEVFLSHRQSFEGLMVKMFSVGEKSGRLAELLEDLSDFYEKEVDERLDNISTVIEPILMLLVGVGVAALILAIIGPIYQMIGSLSA